MSRDCVYITTPIFYPNDKPHIGHAYTDVAADVLARFHRLDGREVFFLSGTDEHGLKMQQNAEFQALSPIELADKNSALFRKLLDSLNCSYDRFIRTTEPRHYQASQAIWNKMLESGDIYSGCYAGWYSVRQESYFDKKEIVEGKDGLWREPLGSRVEWKEEPTYFFRLSSYQEKLLAFHEDNPDFIAPIERRNEVLSFIRSGLKDLSISRSSFSWGVPVPGDEKHVLYVWVDALTSYLTGIGYPDENSSNWKFWPALHIVGKDIVRFHAVYWPAFLMSARIPLPSRVFAHGFLFNRGEKMSKSLGNVIDPFDLIESYGVDPLRYFLMREVPFGQDGGYSHKAMINRIDSDLANDLGNLVHRALSMIAQHSNQTIPAPGDFTNEDQQILNLSFSILQSIRSSMEKQAIHLALTSLFTLVAETNRYFAAQAPWSLRRTNPERMNSVLYTTAEIIRRIALMCQPFMPTAASTMLDFLSVPPDKRTFMHCSPDFSLSAGVTLPPAYPLFPRYEKNFENEI